MIKKILVPLDGSKLAESALPLASVMAERLKASVTLIHIIEINAPKTIHGQAHLMNKEQAEIYLKHIAETAFPAESIIDYHVHYPGVAVADVARGLAQHEKEFDHDLVIMCVHGKGKAVQIMFGNIGQQVVAFGKIPVLIVRPEAEDKQAHYPFGSLLVPLDHQAEHLISLTWAAEFARAFSGNIHLLMVIPTWETLPGREAAASRFLPGSAAKLLDMSVRDAEEYLAKQKANLEKSGLKVQSTVSRGEPAKGIERAVRLLKTDLIVMSTHGKSGLSAFWQGSIAAKVCSRCRIPLLLIPAAKSN
jgi:nucleotide-binding universal stress UspA family protein